MLQSKLAQIAENRATSQPLPTGSAPYTSSSFFKVQKPGDKPNAKNLKHRFSSDSYNLQVSPLKAASRGYKHNDMISLGTARPSPQYFPWEVMHLECPHSDSPGVQSPLGSGLTMDCVRGESDYDLAVAMNYGFTTGSPQLLRYVTEHTELIHNPPYADWASCLTCGTTSALEIAFRIFCNPGDTVLTEGYVYSGTIAAARAQGLKVQGVDMDDQGLVPSDLDHKLTTWNPAKGPKPFVLYMIPTGQNPTGATQSLERRKEIYELAEKHDLYILEDDPYYFIHLGTDSCSLPSNLDHYLSRLPASFLSLDVSGRVLRMDTTSKILAPGLRLGWVTASTSVIDKFISYSEVGVLCPSGPSQVMAYKLLDKTWGHEGFIRWLMNLSAEYRRRRDVLIAACDKHLPSEFCGYRVPEVGMFLWVSLDLSQLGLASQHASDDTPWKTYLDIEGEVFSQAQKNGVLVSRGSWFMNDVKEMRGVSFRMTFAAAEEDSLDRAVERFGHALQSQIEKRQRDWAAREISLAFGEKLLINKPEVLAKIKPLQR
ncbi:hypothetical protein FDECE_4091 [Fusarium decemcellulare]|nr:hypothetical protein FDECE_4091 [Fusarium decemcellulare]